MISFSDDKRALAVLELLHSRGTDLAAAYRTTQDGVTYNFFALHDATMHAATSCIQFLLSIGADPDAVGCSPDHQKPGTADDWEGNFDLKYSNIYGDGINLIPSKVDPVKALFERAREAKQGGKKAGKTAGKTAHDACAACGKAGDELKMCTACKMVKYCNRDCQKTHWSMHKAECKRRAAKLLNEEQCERSEKVLKVC